MTAIPDRLASTPALWRRSDVRDSSRWTHVLAPPEQDELLRIVRALRGRTLSSLAVTDLPREGALAAAARSWRVALQTGLGFVLVRGVPVDALGPAELELACAALGLHLGTLVPQNLSGELLTHVRDTGADPARPSTRLYTTRAEQDFHTDGADIISLLCRRGARSGGASRIASSGAIADAIRRDHPELFAVLFEDFPWHYQEEGHPPFWFARPICTVAFHTDGGAILNTFFIPWYIRRSQELPDAPRLTDAQRRAVALLEELANDPAFHLDMTFLPGDVQYLKNAAILHKRTAYEDHGSDGERRHLLRLWLSAPDFADGDPQLRGGITEERVR